MRALVKETVILSLCLPGSLSDDYLHLNMKMGKW